MSGFDEQRAPKASAAQVTEFAKPAALAPDEPHYHGHRERLKDRFREAGHEALPDCELLELVLFRSIPRRDVKALAIASPRAFKSTSNSRQLWVLSRTPT